MSQCGQSGTFQYLGAFNSLVRPSATPHEVRFIVVDDAKKSDSAPESRGIGEMSDEANWKRSSLKKLVVANQPHPTTE
jgi:hypothetical protein